MNQTYLLDQIAEQEPLTLKLKELKVKEKKASRMNQEINGKMNCLLGLKRFAQMKQSVRPTCISSISMACFKYLQKWNKMTYLGDWRSFACSI